RLYLSYAQRRAMFTGGGSAAWSNNLRTRSRFLDELPPGLLEYIVFEERESYVASWDEDGSWNPSKWGSSSQARTDYSDADFDRRTGERNASRPTARAGGGKQAGARFGDYDSDAESVDFRPAKARRFPVPLSSADTLE